MADEPPPAHDDPPPDAPMPGSTLVDPARAPSFDVSLRCVADVMID